MRLFISFIFCLMVLPSSFAAESIYTKIELETGCIYYGQYEQGANAYCSGLKGYPVHFAEGDLRQMVRFGHIGEVQNQWESFGQFNHIGDMVEWRLSKNIPYAAILRWFIENSNENGEYSKELEGQVLVVSTVASHAKPQSCVVGYVDARANKQANKMAREVADTLAKTFKCGIDTPKFHGKRGESAGSPSRSFQ